MASTRRSRPADPGRDPAATDATADPTTDAAARGGPGEHPPAPQDAADPVARAIAAALPAWKSAAARIGPAGPVLRVAVGLSGGCDSMALLDALARCARAILRWRSQQSTFTMGCPRTPTRGPTSAARNARCAAFRSPCTGVTVVRERGESLEAAARNARFAVFAGTEADVIALAHHADDQAETLLLQLLRGAGPKGLAAMPAFRRAAGRPALARPLLDAAACGDRRLRRGAPARMDRRRIERRHRCPAKLPATRDRAASGAGVSGLSGHARARGRAIKPKPR